MSHIQVRFNTHNNGGLLPWRIFIDGEEFLASQIEIIGVVKGELSYEGEVQKYNIACDGEVTWDGTIAKVVTKHSKQKTVLDVIKNFWVEVVKVYSNVNLL
jgi:hypothetical protein